jgi:hypothetical protein
MRILLDNATVTGALRAAGFIAVTDRSLFDLDVTALRVLIDAIVLADEIVIPDTYKLEHRPGRKDILSHGVFRHQAVPGRLDRSLSRGAVAHVTNWELGRKLGTSYVGVFDELKLLFRHAWRESESFLVLKALGLEDKYNSAIVKGLLETVPDQAILSRRRLSKGYNHETSKMVQMIVWSAVRTVYHRELSKITGTEYLPHPLRNVHNAHCILFDNHPDTRKTKVHSRAARIRAQRMGTPDLHIAQFIRNLWTTCNSADDNIFGVATFDAELPPFLAIVLERLGKRPEREPAAVLAIALELREERGCEALRKRLAELWSTPRSVRDEAAAIREFSRDLRDLRQRLQVYLGYERERVTLSAKVLSYQMTVPRCMTKPLYPSKPHLAFLRDVVLELAGVSTMGRLLDTLWSIRRAS